MKLFVFSNFRVFVINPPCTDHKMQRSRNHDSQVEKAKLGLFFNSGVTSAQFLSLKSCLMPSPGRSARVKYTLYTQHPNKFPSIWFA